MPATPDFGAHVRAVAAEGNLVVQPRMGFTDPGAMLHGLRAVRAARAATVGTVTLDSYTRVGDLAAAAAAARTGAELNGYPLLSHPLPVTAGILAGVPRFPVQVRHGCATPGAIVDALMAAGIGATEGGPVSYCLPYGRIPLRTAITAWERACARFATMRERGVEPHLETFGGCLLGQLCPPGLLVAMSVLEALFFCHHGLRSVSLSYAQQVDHEQDVEAVLALRALAADLLPTSDWHIVVYAYMGVFPATAGGAVRLLERAAELAAVTGSERLIVKTTAEAHRIPTTGENVAALETAARAAARTAVPTPEPGTEHGTVRTTQTYREAAAIVGAVLDLSPDPGAALLRAFRRGYLDVPFCLHPDNAGRTRGYIGRDGRLGWDRIGALPIGDLVVPRGAGTFGAADLLRDLGLVRDREDAYEAGPPDQTTMPPTTGAPVTESSSSSAPVARLTR